MGSHTHKKQAHRGQESEHDCNHNHNHNHNHDHDHQHEQHRNHGHGHGHHHHGHGHHHSHAPNNKKGLIIALTITTGIMLLEFFGGLVTNSLALLSDSGHMLNDAASLALSLFALWLSGKAATSTKSYGYHRFEILAALVNGVTLFVIAFFIAKEAYERFFAPPEVASGSMMAIATVGLLANLASAWALMRGSDVKDNVNVRSAYLHVLGDALGSVGAIVAGALMLAFGWYIADPIISVLVAILILRGAWGVIGQTVHILMEGTPSRIDIGKVKHTLESIDGVRDVHDLHVWTITSGMDSLSAHLLIEDGLDEQIILQEAVRLMERQFAVSHCTIQIETSDVQHADLKV
ncbi:cation transporter [Paenibacillus antri]|uniref:Cation transporter n=1 Tax=Paenibacillus antri TaxID=2582848 RepID=A0A5R9G6X0_9BACL|nr:cation diffusion facilitator family transporter [Paenibacillus antri]TLS48734.1 cation transporter [Paenibacillus antri]